MKRILIYINNLSIDVVIGALMSSLFASRITGVQPEISFWVIFVLAVWVVYSADHLVDALRLKNHAHTHRHRFHFRHFRLLSVLVTVAAITSVSMAVLYAHPQIFNLGVLIGLIVLIYLVLVHFTGGRNNVFLQKEVMVATVYVTGVWGGPMVLAWKTLVAMDWLFAVIFLLLAFTNVLYFTVFDADSDTIDHHPTLLTRIGLRKTLMLFYALSLTTCLAACFSFFYTDLTLYKIASLIYILMDLMMVTLIFYKKTTIVGVNYRYLGEMVFWLPGLLLLG